MSTLFQTFFQKINKTLPVNADFTGVLEHILPPPKMLYFRGKMPENVAKCVAIVGTRHNTRYGEEVAYKLAFELAKRGAIIVSGLAYGIDSIAHRAALDAKGKTVAVLGTPIDEIYPRAHEGLAREIIEKDGMILSEYAPGETVYPKTSFLARNRIIAGLSDAVVIVEAAERSGSLNTAMHALDQGKNLFAVPGNITNPLSQGCNRLIQQGAMPYTRIEDVLMVLFPEETKKKRKKSGQMLIFGDTEEETAILRCVAEGVQDGEEIMAKLKMPVMTFNQTVTMMEIKGMIRSLGANCWGLN